MEEAKEVNEISVKSARGKKSRAAGMRFEARVRADLEKLGWTVSKWMNTVDFDKEGKIGKLVPAKRKFNPFSKAFTIGTGFPDFIAYRSIELHKVKINSADASHDNLDFANELAEWFKSSKPREIIGVEVKKNGYLDKFERAMFHWLIDNSIFSKILIAKMGKKRGEVEYIDFKEKYADKK